MTGPCSFLARLYQLGRPGVVPSRRQFDSPARPVFSSQGMKLEKATGRRSTAAGRRGAPTTISSNYDSLFVHRKNALYRRAAELSAITDCSVGIILLSPEGELSQFSTAPMKKLLRSYAKLCGLPHEIHTMESIQAKIEEQGGEGIGLKVGDHRKGVGGGRGGRRRGGSSAGKRGSLASLVEVAVEQEGWEGAEGAGEGEGLDGLDGADGAEATEALDAILNIARVDDDGGKGSEGVQGGEGVEGSEGVDGIKGGTPGSDVEELQRGKRKASEGGSVHRLAKMGRTDVDGVDAVDAVEAEVKEEDAQDEGPSPRANGFDPRAPVPATCSRPIVTQNQTE